jgi:hypothetical protein
MNFPPIDSLLKGHSFVHANSNKEIIRISVDYMEEHHAGGKRSCTVYYDLDGKPTGGKSVLLTDDLVADYSAAFPLRLDFREIAPEESMPEWIARKRAEGWTGD